ncbi:MAG: Fe3+/spermidine/putrescine ABC transporter ATP-binding protein [Acidiferrobacteraceae bacterium]|nr:Fe3+/spermidine/putrescine ABC transporter ATP-binding protein [Acidiferrobacteraceae bacterium]|tara:strand:- start:1018 stop:2118 length:1101 start_codon:yes stop_codon:yes gene_type:complete
MKEILEVRNLNKVFAGDITAAEDVSFSIQEGEFVTLLGPSGCGKTTTLRMISGFEYPDSGQVILDNRDVTNLAPYKRPVNMMFQDFALWPHMTVTRNIAYGLTISRIDKDTIQSEVSKALDLVDLKAKANSFPQDLSIGQKQRIALARAIIKKPRILLLDEPMSALDAKLRESMQTELRELQKSLGMTFIMVTHDQTEAMRMSDRIIVMRDGQIIQAGSPTDLYESPATPYVAEFLGQANVIDAVVENVGPRHCTAIAGKSVFTLQDIDAIKTQGQPIKLCVRPEKIIILNTDHAPKDDENLVEGTLINTSYSGNSMRYEVDIGCKESLIIDQQLTAAISAITVPLDGAAISCCIPPQAISVFANT